jgi:hypothetical protein
MGSLRAANGVMSHLVSLFARRGGWQSAIGTRSITRIHHHQRLAMVVLAVSVIDRYSASLEPSSGRSRVLVPRGATASSRDLRRLRRTELSSSAACEQFRPAFRRMIQSCTTVEHSRRNARSFVTAAGPIELTVTGVTVDQIQFTLANCFHIEAICATDVDTYALSKPSDAAIAMGPATSVLKHLSPERSHLMQTIRH